MRCIVKETRYWLRKHNYAAVALLAILFLISWQIVVSRGLLSEKHFSSPKAILCALARDLTHTSPTKGIPNEARTLFAHSLITLRRYVICLAVAGLLGVTTGFVFGRSKTLYALGQHPINLFRALPSAVLWVLLPLFGITFRWAQPIVIVLGATWPILVGSIQAVRRVPQELLDNLKCTKLRGDQRALLLLLAASPGIFTGLLIGNAVAFLLTLTVEVFYTNQGGIGWYLQANYNVGNRAEIFGAIVLVALLGWGANTLLEGMQHFLFPAETKKKRQKLARIGSHFLPKRMRHLLFGWSRTLQKVRDTRLREALESATVTEKLKKHFGDGIALNVLYQGPPYLFPTALEELGGEYNHLIQRDITLSVSDGGIQKPILFARSWINQPVLPDNFRRQIERKKKTIGEIVRENGEASEYEDLDYRLLLSEKLGSPFGVRGAIETVQRVRIIKLNGNPAILIHEFVPVWQQDI